MALSMAAATLAGGITTGGTSIIAGLLNLYSTAQTNKQNLALYEEETARDQANQRANRKLQSRALDLNTRQEDFNESNTLYNRSKDQEKTNYDRSREQYNEAVKLLSTKSGLMQNRMAPFSK